MMSSTFLACRYHVLYEATFLLRVDESIREGPHALHRAELERVDSNNSAAVLGLPGVVENFTSLFRADSMPWSGQEHAPIRRIR